MFAKSLWSRAEVMVAFGGTSRGFCCSTTARSFESILKEPPTGDFFQPLISPEELRSRQTRLLDLVDSGGQVKRESSLLMVSAAQKYYQADTKIPPIHFKQNSDFLYFTGLNTREAANSVLLLMDPGRVGEKSVKSILFVPFSTDHQRLWEGEQR